jgi:transposase
MRKQEKLAMNVKERDRLKVLHEVKQGHMTQRGAAGQPGVTDRWVRKLLVRMKKEGDVGILHRLRGRESNRRLAESVRGKVLKLMKAKYHDFRPTLACEYLGRDDGVTLSKETLRQLLIGAGLRRVKRRRVEEEWTQIGRALRELGIGWIAAHSPQAKGRIDRFFGTAQDRLVKGLRLAGANSLETAQAYVEQEYLPQWNRDFTVVPAGTTDAHRPLGAEHQLAAILSHVEESFVTSDYTIRYQGKIYQIARGDIRPGLRGGLVRVEQRLDGSMAVKFRKYDLHVAERQAPAKMAPRAKPTSAPKPRPQVASDWMKGFNLRQSPPLNTSLAAERSDRRHDSG